jgi:hypothetical protein
MDVRMSTAGEGCRRRYIRLRRVYEVWPRVGNAVLMSGVSLHGDGRLN